MSRHHRPTSFTRIPAALLTLGAATAACIDFNAPQPTEIDVSVSMVNAQLAGSDTAPQIRCKVSLSANALGARRDRRVWWSGAVFNFFSGQNRTRPLEMDVSAQEVANSWDGPVIQGGEHRDASWEFVGTAPFSVNMEFYYGPQYAEPEELQVAKTRFACGPEAWPDLMPPEVTEVSLDRLPSDVMPGDTVTVNYRATSTVGLWVTEVMMFGKECAVYDFYFERLEPVVSRAAPIVVPADCGQGPYVVRVTVFDGALQRVSRIMGTGDHATPAPAALPALEARLDGAQRVSLRTVKPSE